MLVGLIFLFLNKQGVAPGRIIRVGICGCVNHQAVYSMRDGSDLSMLVRMANGFRLSANISKVNLDKVIMNDSIYHIPCSSINSNTRNAFIGEINQTIKNSYIDISKQVVEQFKDKEIKQYNILYVGLPAVFVLINYYPEFNRINFVHIPQSTIFLTNEYRITDVFFTLGIYPTMQIVQNRLKQKIDYYLIQDRMTFIDLINLLGGVNIKLDESYADEYNFKPGQTKIDGFHSWEFIRFLDWKHVPMKVNNDKTLDLVRQDNFEADPRTWEMIYEMRNQRQRYMLEGMRNAFKSMTKPEQLNIVSHFKDVFQTDMPVDFLMKLYEDVLSTKSFSYGNLPGYYSEIGNKLFYYPDIPSFDMLRRSEIRTYLEKRKERKQTVY
jgi:anionic cell wall polymer biosynthesis LytR-Cps2A-Psr (LCP) family protein